MKVAMIGLGKLGLPCAEAMANYHEVSGFDITPKSSKSVKVKTTLKDTVLDAEIIFIAVPTPHDQRYDGRTPIADLPSKNFDYVATQNVIRELNEIVTPNQDVVLISTVLPGTIRNEIAPLAKNINLIYNPYFIAMGTVAEDFLNPEFFIIGTSDASPKRSARLVNFYKSMIPDVVTQVGTWEEAEAVKIFYNTFISFKLSFVNMIQDVAMKIGHMNVDVVTDALLKGHKRIISPMYMSAGMGDGGPCHPRDNIALRDLAERLDLGYDLYSSIMQARESQAKNLAQYLVNLGRSITILGTAFKPGVPFIDGSYSLLVGHYITELGKTVTYWDPMIPNLQASGAMSPQTYLLAHNTPNLFEYPFFEGSTIVDPWRKCPQINGCKVIHYGNSRPALQETVSLHKNTSTSFTENNANI